jgi:hypothetical protein
MPQSTSARGPLFSNHVPVVVAMSDKYRAAVPRYGLREDHSTLPPRRLLGPVMDGRSTEFVNATPLIASNRAESGAIFRDAFHKPNLLAGGIAPAAPSSLAHLPAS